MFLFILFILNDHYIVQIWIGSGNQTVVGSGLFGFLELKILVSFEYLQILVRVLTFADSDNTFKLFTKILNSVYTLNLSNSKNK